MSLPEKKTKITVNEVDFLWSVRSWPSWCWNNEDFNGLSLLIESTDVRTRRCLIVDFPLERKATKTKPPLQRPRIPPAKIVNLIEEAQRLGWDPESRGKPFVMQVDFLGN